MVSDSGIVPVSFSATRAWRVHGVGKSFSPMKVISNGWTPPVARKIIGSMSCSVLGRIDARNAHWSGKG
jgi:hypothetical protein